MKIIWPSDNLSAKLIAVTSALGITPPAAAIASATLAPAGSVTSPGV